MNSDVRIKKWKWNNVRRIVVVNDTNIMPVFFNGEELEYLKSTLDIYQKKTGSSELDFADNIIPVWNENKNKKGYPSKMISLYNEMYAIYEQGIKDNKKFELYSHLEDEIDLSKFRD